MVPEPALLLTAFAALGVIAAIVGLAFRRVRTRGAIVLAVAVACLGAGVYLVLPTCQSAEVLHGGLMLRCTDWTSFPFMVVLGIVATVGGACGVACLARSLDEPTRRGLAIAFQVCVLPAGLIVTYGVAPVVLWLLLRRPDRLVRHPDRKFLYGRPVTP